MLNTINKINFQDIYNKYNSNKNINKTDVDETTDKDETEQTTEDKIDSILDSNKEAKASYNMSFAQRSQIQQQMQMESMLTQFTLTNQAINSGTSYTAPIDTASILSGQQVANQINVINTSVGASTQDKNDYITDRISGTDTSSDEDETDKDDNSDITGTTK